MATSGNPVAGTAQIGDPGGVVADRSKRFGRLLPPTPAWWSQAPQLSCSVSTSASWCRPSQQTWPYSQRGRCRWCVLPTALPLSVTKGRSTRAPHHRRRGIGARDPLHWPARRGLAIWMALTFADDAQTVLVGLRGGRPLTDRRGAGHHQIAPDHLKAHHRCRHSLQRMTFGRERCEATLKSQKPG